MDHLLADLAHREHTSPALLIRYARLKFAPNRADVVAALLLAGAAVLVARGATQMSEPLSALRIAPVTLDPVMLPQYAVLTTLRMFRRPGRLPGLHLRRRHPGREEQEG